MRKKVAKKLYIRSLVLAEYKDSTIEEIHGKRPAKHKTGFFESFIMRRYKKGSPRIIYKKLKRKWNNIPKSLRCVDKINVMGI